MKPARRRATYQDVIDAPEHLVAEIIEGELYTSPRPASPHALATSGIGADLFGNFNSGGGAPERPGGWWILDEPELHIGDDVLVPDLAGWRRSRLPRLPDAAFFTDVPDWVCEVISPSTASLDRNLKMPIYARAGVECMWLVLPLARTIEIYQVEGGEWRLSASHTGDERLRAAPFEAVALDTSRWWMET